MNYFQRAYHKDLKKIYSNFSGVILDNVVGEISDLQSYFEEIRMTISPKDKLLISYHNHFWEPILTLASYLRLRKKVGVQNWIEQKDLTNLLEISGFQVISEQKRFYGITMVTTARPRNNNFEINKNYTVSIIIPAKNEEGNISKIVPSIPKFGLSREIIFVEGNSSDKTWEKIQEEKIKYKYVKAYKQNGTGKADAVKLGLKHAKGEILIIYDADCTVNPKDLRKFYHVLSSGIGEFANGSRMVYPMENQAMQTLNKIGNKVFSTIFTQITGQRFRDTLCGTKAFFKKDYLKFKDVKLDPFGDFYLIFGAIRNNLKVIEIPVKYRERTYGSTNIHRFRHGLMLIKITLSAFKEFKL